MTNSMLILTIETLLSLGTSALVIYLLQPVLQALLKELCHGEIHARFWSTFTRLMLLMAPLLVVLLYSHSPSAEEIDIARVIRDSLLHILTGEFIGLLTVGIILLRFARRDLDDRTLTLPVMTSEKER